MLASLYLLGDWCVVKNASSAILAVAFRIKIKDFPGVVELPSEFPVLYFMRRKQRVFSNYLLHSSWECIQATHFAGGSAFMLQIISTFSSLAAPTRTTLSVAQIGASK